MGGRGGDREGRDGKADRDAGQVTEVSQGLVFNRLFEPVLRTCIGVLTYLITKQTTRMTRATATAPPTVTPATKGVRLESSSLCTINKQI